MKALPKETGKVLPLDKGSDVLKQLPAPPPYLSSVAKKHYEKFGKILISAEVLKRTHIGELEMLSVNYEQWEWAVREIKTKNKEHHGKGYIQKFHSGAQNVSVYITLKRDAEKAIMQCFKQFGLDPRSEKELKNDANPNQLNLFNELKKSMSS